MILLLKYFPLLQNMTLLSSYLYMYLVADVEKNSLSASGSPSSATVFTMERYVMDTHDYYYKLRIQNTENFVYFTGDGTLGVGVSWCIYIIDMCV